MSFDAFGNSTPIFWKHAQETVLKAKCEPLRGSLARIIDHRKERVGQTKEVNIHKEKARPTRYLVKHRIIFGGKSRVAHVSYMWWN